MKNKNAEEILKLKQYLFEDVFSYFDDISNHDERFRYLSKKGIITNPFLNKMTEFFIPFYHKYAYLKRRKIKKNETSIFFYADPIVYSDIVAILASHVNLFFNNPRRFPSIARNKKRSIIFFPLLLIARDLIEGYETKNDQLLFNSVQKLRNLFSKINPDVIVLNDSIYPINRALIFVAKELGILTIEIQHAIYPSEMKLIPGKGANYVFVWGKYFKLMYLQQNIRTKETLKILGYPFSIIQKGVDMNKKKLELYYLAQGFQHEDINNLDILLDNALKIKGTCEKFNIAFNCRLHPNSPPVLLNKVLPKIECTPKEETIGDSIINGDIFVSFNSTALIQAALNGKHCIQLKNIPVITDDFEELGICPKTFTNTIDLEVYLKEISQLKPHELRQLYKPINPNYINIPEPNPGIKFYSLIKEILAEKDSALKDSKIS